MKLCPIQYDQRRTQEKVLRGHAKISRLIYHYSKDVKAVENLSGIMKN
jgi:hypothetical protein